MSPLCLNEAAPNCLTSPRRNNMGCPGKEVPLLGPSVSYFSDGKASRFIANRQCAAGLDMTDGSTLESFKEKKTVARIRIAKAVQRVAPRESGKLRRMSGFFSLRGLPDGGGELVPQTGQPQQGVTLRARVCRGSALTTEHV